MRIRGVILTLFLAPCVVACTGPVLETVSKNSVSPRSIDGAVLSYYLARAEMGVTFSYASKDGSLTISPDSSVKAFPDIENAKYDIVYRHGGLSTDDVTVGWDNGLLKQVASTSQDQTVDLVKNLNAFVSQTAALQTALAAASRSAETKIQGVLPSGERKSVAQEACPDDIKVYSVADLTNGGERKIPSQISQNCYLDIAVTPKLIQGSELSVFGNAGSQPSNPRAICEQAVCFRLAGIFEVSVAATLRKKDGTAVQGLMPNGKTGPFTTTARYQVIAPIRDKIGFVRFNRRAFVANTTSIAFTNGIVSEFKSKDPSEIVGFLTLPTELAKSVTLTIPLVK